MSLASAGLKLGSALACVAVGLCLVAPGNFRADAQPPPAVSADSVQITGVVRELAVRLAAADRLAADHRWQDAIDEYLDLIREHGDALVPVDPTGEPLAMGQRFVQARWLAHQRVGALGPDAWTAFRNRTQHSALQRFQRGASERDPRQLRRVVEEAFCSPAATEALELLGDLAFERGNFAEAQHWWRLLVRPASVVVETGKQRPLLCPPPPGDVAARVRAKQIVTLLFQEQAARVPAELQAFRPAHAGSKGTIAGRSGAYADLISELLKEGQGSVPAMELEWPTFAGDFSRNRDLSVPPSPRLWADGPAWRVRLDTGDKLLDTTAPKPLAGTDAARHFGFHPIIAGDLACVADSRYVRGFALRTGRLAFQYDLLKACDIPGGEELTAKLPVPAQTSFTLTAADDCLYARLGGTLFGPLKEGEKRPTGSWLVCLSLPATAPKEARAPYQHRWLVEAPAAEGELAMFEGAPVVAGKSVYTVVSRLRGNKVQAALCCFDAATGQPRWEQALVESPLSEDRATRRQHLLTLAGPYLVYCSHAGAVLAVDATTGKTAWAVRYASRNLKGSPRDLCPAVAAGHHVVVAPADLDRLVCLDVMTGRSVWQREAIEVVHLLGTSRGQLIFTTPHGIRAVALTTGEDEGGWRQPLAGNLDPCGRGLLAGELTFWPTLDAKLTWRVLDVMDGTVTDRMGGYEPAALRALPPGNVIAGGGCLVIATSEELWGFVPPPQLGRPPQT
jgi:outer membrane protein assembly factor BamB